LPHPSGFGAGPKICRPSIGEAENHS
jgi:hypothetical protein